MSKETAGQCEEKDIQSPKGTDQNVSDNIAANEMSRELDAVSALRSLAMPSRERSPSPMPDESDGDDSDNEEMDATEGQSDRMDEDVTTGKILIKKSSFPQKVSVLKFLSLPCKLLFMFFYS